MGKKQPTKTQVVNYEKLLKTSSTVTSFEELSKVTGISYTNIREAFKNHPEEYKNMKKKFSEKRKETQQEENVMSKSNFEKVEEVLKEENVEKRYVIDASISHTPDLRKRIENICNEPDSKVILTSTTVKELVSLDRYPDGAGADAKYLLGIAAENPEKFIPVFINENYPKPDDAIIAYCAENKENLVLLTADREMTLFARMYGVTVDYIKHVENVQEFKHSVDIKKESFVESFPESFSNLSGMPIKTLKCTIYEYGNLFVNCGFFSDRAMVVYSKGTIYTDTGRKKLEIGDEVLIAKKYKDAGYITFSNFLIREIAYSDNAVLKDCARVYDIADMSESITKDKRYIGFIKDFSAYLK